MSAEDFKLIGGTKIDDSLIKRDFIKIYHQSGVDVNNETSNIKYSFGESHTFIKTGNGFSEFDIKVKKDNKDNFSINAPGHDIIRLVNNAFAHTILDARLSSSSGVKIAQINFVGPVSTYTKRW